jgi:hypothetical protein
MRLSYHRSDPAFASYIRGLGTTRDKTGAVTVHPRRARRLALAACVLWLVGIELLPNLHVALHDHLAAHRHDAGGMVVTVTYGEVAHVHADGTIHRPGRTRPTHDKSALGQLAHGDGIAHHSVAMAPVAPPITEPLPVDRHTSFLAIAIADHLSSIDPLAATARGPPPLA